EFGAGPVFVFQRRKILESADADDSGVYAVRLVPVRPVRGRPFDGKFNRGDDVRFLAVSLSLRVGEVSDADAIAFTRWHTRQQPLIEVPLPEIPQEDKPARAQSQILRFGSDVP